VGVELLIRGQAAAGFKGVPPHLPGRCHRGVLRAGCGGARDAAEEIPRQQQLGFTTFCIKPSIFIDNMEQHAAFCHDVVERVEALTSR
jgi:hypothetical protein